MVPTDTKDDRKITFPDEDENSLRNDFPWRELFPELLTVEAARREEDPVFWLRTNDDGSWFYVAGYSTDAIQGVVLSVDEIMRGGSSRFWGLMVLRWDKTMK